MMPAEQVLLSALELASAICANAPLAVAASKKIMRREARTPVDGPLMRTLYTESLRV
jgi:enoyl-CoA hydratase/carnithine racemase